MNDPLVRVSLDPRSLRRVYLILGAINILLLGGYALVLARLIESPTAPIRALDPSVQFNLSAEGGVAAVWYSTSLSVVLAVVATTNYWIDQAKFGAAVVRGSIFRYGWLLLAASALYVSLDDAIELHEQVAGAVATTPWISVEWVTDTAPVFLWIALLGPIILGVGLALLGFFVYWLASAPRARILAAIGITFWIAVPLLEYVEARLERLYGLEGGAVVRFFEESLEVVGATLLLIAAVEYLIGQAEIVGLGASQSPPESGRWAVVVGTASPLLLFPLAAVGALANSDVRDTIARSAYQYGALRIEHVMHSDIAEGHSLLLSDTCNLDAFRERFAYPTDLAGPLVDHPKPGVRQTSPDWSLAVFGVGPRQSRTVLDTSLGSLALASTNIWHLECARTAPDDQAIRAWLEKNVADVESIRLLGWPALVLTRAVPDLPFVPPTSTYDAADATFGAEAVNLVGYQVRVGEIGGDLALHVQLLWEAQRTLNTDYHVFVHLVDADGSLVSQEDGVPVYGRYPATAWQPQQTVLDSYSVPVPSDFELDQGQLLIGLYDFETMQRVPAGDSDHVALNLQEILDPTEIAAAG